jgi:hypothetical protein
MPFLEIARIDAIGRIRRDRSWGGDVCEIFRH